MIVFVQRERSLMCVLISSVLSNANYVFFIRVYVIILIVQVNYSTSTRIKVIL